MAQPVATGRRGGARRGGAAGGSAVVAELLPAVDAATPRAARSAYRTVRDASGAARSLGVAPRRGPRGRGQLLRPRCPRPLRVGSGARGDGRRGDGRTAAARSLAGRPGRRLKRAAAPAAGARTVVLGAATQISVRTIRLTNTLRRVNGD